MWALVVENDDRVARALRRSLHAEGYDVERVAAVAAARRAIARQDFVIALVDLGLDDGDGVDVIRALRDHPSTGVIAVTARGATSDRVRGLRAGADDYLVKPFGIAELMARIDAVMRRLRMSSVPLESQGRIGHGQLCIDRDRHEVLLAGSVLPLTRKEFDVLVLLALNVDVVVERDRILDHVWQSAREGNTRTLDTHMASLRMKLGAAASITTVRGVGYRLESATES
ncbi:MULTISPECIES: response regulator transcription factor [Nocardiaceae]|jgi:DNA-binding response OmpR family regulator|uniref:response regulator transcription factor n=1 Tax=Nocardiaceae TaxID=85025 RepID=UPI00055EB0D3|nr:MULTISPECIES: response regulator transcription factor [Rhodococcus]OZF05475.1 DNA-binding response regulator [Rhodococcus sp. 15-1189-1-1a]OZF20258.1 DNA-binding response regulator [Rhodococcus sp. 14-2686-1-2]OZF56375.1 DNA-binding response regulator [Rhodococcus sp. 14-2470-1b]